MKFIKSVLPYILIVACVVLLRTYVVSPVEVNGDSMEPTLLDNELLLLNKLYKEINRFDIVVINYEGKNLVKRVVGLPNEIVEYKDNKLLIDNKEVEETFISEITRDFKQTSKISEDTYFVMGDNRNNSTDSRIIGLIDKEDIEGKVIFILYPFNKMGSIK